MRARKTPILSFRPDEVIRSAERIEKIRHELTTVRRQRSTQREGRQRHQWPLASIVGYTNAGKSTLLNKLTGAAVPDAQARQLAALVARRRQLIGMATAEENRLQQTPDKRIQRSIKRLLRTIETELGELDRNEVSEVPAQALDNLLARFEGEDAVVLHLPRAMSRVALKSRKHRIDWSEELARELQAALGGLEVEVEEPLLAS